MKTSYFFYIIKPTKESVCMKEDIFENLRVKIEDRLSRDNFVDNGEEISLNTLQESLQGALGEYNKVFVDDTRELAKNINKQTFLNRVFKGDVPMVHSINPVILEDGNYYLEVLLSDRDGKYKGEAIIDKNFRVKFNFLKSEYSKEKTVQMLKNYSVKYINYFEKLINFSFEYPNTKCSWGNQYDMAHQRVDDGFLVCHFYLDNLSSTSFSFSSMDDNNIARTRSKKYGELFDYIDFYRGKLLKNTSVNINDLNDLYQQIVRKQLNLEKEPTLKMNKLHKYIL